MNYSVKMNKLSMSFVRVSSEILCLFKNNNIHLLKCVNLFMSILYCSVKCDCLNGFSQRRVMQIFSFFLIFRGAVLEYNASRLGCATLNSGRFLHLLSQEAGRDISDKNFERVR